MKSIFILLVIFCNTLSWGQSRFLETCKNVNGALETSPKYQTQISWLKLVLNTEDCNSVYNRIKNLSSFTEFIPNPISNKPGDQFNQFKPKELKSSIHLEEKIRIKWIDALMDYQDLDLFEEFDNIKHIFHNDIYEKNLCDILSQFKNIDSVTMLSLELNKNEIECIKKKKIKIFIMGIYTPTITSFEIKDQIYGIENYQGDIEHIYHYSNLSYLGLIRYSGQSNLKILSVLRNLTSLQLNTYDILNLEGLENLQDLKYLSINCYQKDIRCNDKALKDISFISNLKFLIGLDLSWNKIEDIEPLTKLPKLKYINLRMNKIKSLSKIRELKKIEYLDLAGNELKSIQGIRNLSKLKYLNLSANDISEIEEVSSLNRLRYLSLGNNPISDLDNLKIPPSLRLLNLDATSPFSFNDQNVTTLLPTLKKVADEDEISWAELSVFMHKEILETPKKYKQIRNFNLGNLGKFRHIKLLSLGNNNLKIANNLEGLEDLLYFDISGSDLSSITKLPKKIEIFRARNSKNIDISILTKLSNVKVIDIGNNDLAHQEIELKNDSLEVLKMDHCNLRITPRISRSESLVSLELQGNILREFPNLHSTKLAMIDLSRNKLTAIPDLSNILSIREVYLENNYITDLNIQKEINQNIFFSLEGNPIKNELCPLNSTNPSINKFCSSL